MKFKKLKFPLPKPHKRCNFTLIQNFYFDEIQNSKFLVKHKQKGNTNGNNP